MTTDVPEPASPDPVRAWIATAMGAPVISMTRLVGGTHADTYDVRTGPPARNSVLRRYPVGDDAALRERRVLAALDGLDGLCPRLIAGDEDGTVTGSPTTLISRLRGEAAIPSDNTAGWARQLGRALARIHASRPKKPLPLVRNKSGGQPRAVSGPGRDIVLDRWDDLYAAPEVLTHHDFWSGNVVAEAETITGVVDWNGACLGPPSFDLGWCRLDLVLLYDEAAADVMTTAYADALDMQTPDPWLADVWATARSHADVHTWASNYIPLGRTDLTPDTLRRRHDDWTSRLLART
ncbi:phosphotransferase family protein [Solicola gregarius]|uniref:Aminoglycoside phosphotransferase family protein n=1 Tax=Solicola gregarius TaxID=2908642 RepID=A0AA46TL80_9ACTN|nr:aminoglycoside phosphotransferase family protein [Solicola gregarius]UYM07315.1 aminoglycoside phosphotransferase family protein [Solicola gregarius]